ncbi:MAG: hypothetical protein HYX96_02950 [Chloroflexi bacterium]|nr:hypothetical protein [Chloroflexota bacterium]
MRKIFLVLAAAVLLATAAACAGQPGESPASPRQYTEEESRAVAEDFVKNEATFVFDGMPETLKPVNTAQDGPQTWTFTYEFSSRHAGYGNRTGQVLAQVITPHQAVVTVERGMVKSAVMDQIWDMLNQELL